MRATEEKETATRNQVSGESLRVWQLLHCGPAFLGGTLCGGGWSPASSTSLIYAMHVSVQAIEKWLPDSSYALCTQITQCQFWVCGDESNSA